MNTMNYNQTDRQTIKMLHALWILQKMGALIDVFRKSLGMELIGKCNVHVSP